MKREKSATEAPTPWRNPEGFMVHHCAAARASVEGSVKDAAAYAQLQPEKALLWAVGTGYLLRMLPLTGILGVLVRMLIGLLKPAALIYGAAKVWQKAEPYLVPRSLPKPRVGSAGCQPPL